MISGCSKGIGQVDINGLPIVTDLRYFSVHDVAGLNHFPPKGGRDGLMSETNAQYGNFG